MLDYWKYSQKWHLPHNIQMSSTLANLAVPFQLVYVVPMPEQIPLKFLVLFQGTVSWQVGFSPCVCHPLVVRVQRVWAFWAFRGMSNTIRAKAQLHIHNLEPDTAAPPPMTCQWHRPCLAFVMPLTRMVVTIFRGVAALHTSASCRGVTSK